MAVPEFFHFIRPALEIVSINPGIYGKDVAEQAAQRLEIAQVDREETITSGQTKWENRSHWALTYLRQAKLIEKAGRGKSTITQRGIDFLAKGPTPIKPSDLQFSLSF